MSFPTYDFGDDLINGEVFDAEHINEIRAAVEEIAVREYAEGGGGLGLEDESGNPVAALEFDDADFSESYDAGTDTLTISLLGGGGGGAINQGFYETIDPVLVNAAAAVSTANNATLIRMPRLQVSKNFTTITIHVGTASGNVDVGAYTTSDFSTFTRVGSTTTGVAVNGTNANQAISVAFTIPANTDWYLAIAADNATASFARLTSTSPVSIKTANKRIVHKATSFPLPSSLTSMSESTLVGWWMSAS